MTSTSSIDVGASHPIVSFEHVNINSGGRWDESFETFYFKALGFVNDPRAQRMSSKGLKWINMGHQQIHLPASDPAQKVRGHIGLEYSNLSEVEARLQTENIPYRVIRNVNNEVEFIETACPVGNVFHLHQQNNSNFEAGISWLGPLPHIAPSEEIALPGGLASGLGMRYVDFWIPHGSAGKIAAFYAYIFGSNPTISTSAETGTEVCVVSVGCRQSIRYTEVAAPIDADASTAASNSDLASHNTTTNTTHTTRSTIPTIVPDYDYHHIAIYVNDFVGIYTRLKEAGLVYENPRFPFRYGTVEEVSCLRVCICVYLLKLYAIFR